MCHAYYRIWASKVICFGWLVVVVQQGVGGVWRPGGCAEWLFEPSPMGLARRELSAAEAAAYAAARVRVQGYLRVGLWVGLLGWAVVSVAWSHRAAAGVWAMAMSGLVGAAVARRGGASAPAAWSALDPRWAEQLVEGEQVLWVSDNRTHLGALRRLWQLSRYRVLLCVQTSARTLLYVRPDQRQKGWRRCPGCGEMAVGYKDDQGFEAVRDHPLLGRRVYLLVHTRRYHCRHRACAQKTFTARGDLAGPHQRWTARFAAGLPPQLMDMDLKTNAQVLDPSFGKSVRWKRS